jgi:hypothetical protein
MRFFAFLAAIILFIIAALIAFFLDESDVSLRAVVGIVSVGLGCVTRAQTPAPPR